MSSCEKYGDWMRDAALGALAPRRERRLLEHVRECDACRKAYQHTRELAGMVDRGVESLVAGEPSPHFAARLRARIAEEPSPARLAWLTWKPLAASLAVAALIAAVVLFRGLQRANPRPTAGLVRPEANSNASRPASDLRPRSQGSNEHPRLAVRGPSHRQLVARHTPSRREPEVIVQPGQLEAVMQFAAEIRSGHIDGKQVIAANLELDKPLEIKSIEIAPLEKAGPGRSDLSDGPVNSTHP